MSERASERLNRLSRERGTRAALRAVARRDIRAAWDKVRAVWVERRLLLARVRAQCRLSAQRSRTAIRAHRVAVLAQLRRDISEMRQAHRNRCQARRVAVRNATGKRVSDAQRKLVELRAEQHLERRILSTTKHATRKIEARKRWTETDEEVRGNLEPELHALWEDVKKGIRGRAGMTRTEAFRHWVHEHPESVYELNPATERAMMKAAIVEHRAAEKAHYIATKKPRRVALSDVPF